MRKPEPSNARYVEPWDRSLRNGCGYLLDSLLCRSQHNQGYTENNKGSHAHEFSAWNYITHSLHRHNEA
jgi:hypothetical protein